MKTRLLFLTLLIALFGTQVYADTNCEFTLNPGGGEHIMPTNTDGNYVTTVTTKDLIHIWNPMKPGCTFGGWNSAYMMPYKMMHYSDYNETTDNQNEKLIPGSYCEAEFGDGKLSPFKIFGHRWGHVAGDPGFIVNFWAWMEDWSEYETGDMRMVSCTEGDGWDMGEYHATSKNMEFFVYLNTEGLNLDLGKKWSDLNTGDNWHMFTLSFYQGNVTALIDAGNTVNVSKTASETGATHISYASGVDIVVGGEPTGSSIDSKHRFKGKIRYLSIIHQGFIPSSTHERAQYWYSNPGRVYFDGYNVYKDDSKTTYSTTALWIDNATTELKFDANGGTGGGASVTMQKAGLCAEITEPKRDDYVHTWSTDDVGKADPSKDASRYVTLYQDIPGVKEYFTRTASGRTKKVPFPGTDANGNTYKYLHIDDQTYKYTDCFTVHFHAKATDWTKTVTSLVSCSDGGGWNITSDGTNILFKGYDTRKGGYTYRSITGASLTDLAKGQEHSFTLVFTGDCMHAYIDGTYQGSVDGFFGSMHYDDDNSIIIGAEANNTPGSVEEEYGYFEGEMWNFCILHTALSPRQVADLHLQRTKPYYYHAPQNATLQANWTPLPLLGVKEAVGGVINSDAFVGETFTKTFTINGNGITTPSVSFNVDSEHVVKAESSVMSTQEEAGTITLEYKAFEVPNTCEMGSIQLWDEAGYSSTKDINLYHRIYRQVGSYEEGKTPAADLHVLVGDEVTTTFTLTGDGHTAPSASVTNEENFRVDNSQFTKDQGTGTVTYAPTTAGTHTATLTIASNSDKAGGNEFTNPEMTLTCHAHQFDIVYWNEKGIGVVMDANDDLKACAFTIGDNTTAVKPTLSKKGEYFLPLENVQQYAGQTVNISFEREGDSGWKGTGKIKMPIFAEKADDIANVDANTDVVIKEACTVSPASSTTMGDLYVQAGATLALGTGAPLTTNALVLYSEGDDVPRVHIPSGSSFTVKAGSKGGATMYFVKRIPADRWYFFSLPYDCYISDICFADGTGRVNPSDAATATDGIYIEQYNGALRVNDPSLTTGWEYVSTGEGSKLTAGQGYVVAIDANQDAKDIVFPMRISTSGDANLSDWDNQEFRAIDVHAYGIDQYNKGELTANYVGWNLVGNPFLSTYKFQDNEKEDVSKLFKTGDIMLNSVENQGYIYLTIPFGDHYYWQGIYNEISLAPFSAFFVQAGDTGPLSFVPASRQHSLQARQASGAKAAPIYAGITLSTSTYSDATTLVIGEDYTQAYEIGVDLEKMLGEGARPQVYIHDSNYKYAFKALNQTDAAGVNDLGVYLPGDGEYTFALKDNCDRSQLQALYLTDTEANVETDLLQSSYTFIGAKTHDKTRFRLSAVLSNDNSTTDLTGATQRTSWTVWQDGALQIRVQGVRIGAVIRVIDSTGRLVAQTVASETWATLALPAPGTYCVQTIGEAGVQAKKMNVNY